MEYNTLYSTPEFEAHIANLERRRAELDFVIGGSYPGKPAEIIGALLDFSAGGDPARLLQCYDGFEPDNYSRALDVVTKLLLGPAKPEPRDFRAVGEGEE